MKTILLLATGLGYLTMSAADGGGDLASLTSRASKLLGTSSSTNPAVQYTTALVEPGQIQRTVKATGTLNATVNVEVGSQLSGQIANLLVDFNDDVKKGQELAVLDQRTFVAQVDQSSAAFDKAQAGVKIAEDGLERAKVNARDAKLQRAVLVARVERARVELDSLKKDATRKTILIQHGAGSAKDMLDAVAKRDAAAASVREAEAILAAQENEIEGSPVDLQRAAAELESARAAAQQAAATLQVARVDLERTKIRSPIDGVVVGRSVDNGQTVATSLEAHTLFTIAGDLKRMEIYAKVDESDIGKIHQGQDASFTVDAFPGRTFKATVRQVRIAPEVLQNVVTYTAVLTTSNPDRILLPGMTALATITVSHSAPVLTVPLAALRFSPAGDAPASGVPSDGQQVALWTQGADGTPKKVSVTTGEDDGKNIALTGGDLTQGSRVIVDAHKEAGSAHLLGLRIGF